MIDARLAHSRSGLPLVFSAALIVVCTAALYWPARDAGFVGDDFMILHRLRELTGAADAWRFFTAEFFTYYRPLGFVSHAIDWLAAGADPQRFHLTNILLHGTNALLVLLIAQGLSPRSLAGPLAALFFALHASNHEAVVWVSARFDVVATAFALGAVCWLVRGWPGHRWLPALFFLPALLSKESVVALPLVPLAWSAFVLGDDLRGVAARGVPWLGALVVYSVLREVAGGISAVGGASRVPKLVVLALAILLLLAISDRRWHAVRAWLLHRRARIGAFGAAGLSMVLLTAILAEGPVGNLLREKLSVAAFALFYLTTPVLDNGTASFSDPSTSVYFLGGAAGLALLGGLALVLWRPLLNDGRFWFLGTMLFATLLPISALTEGERYLYLPSAASSIFLGVVIAELQGRWRKPALAATAIMLALSAAQVHLRIRDWIWAGTMTAAGARLVDAELAPSCNEGSVVFLTSPVGVRGVYTHFYYETFELPRGCIPELFQVVLRVQRVDAQVNVRWEGPGRIVMTVPRYAGQFVASKDLRTFDVPIATDARLTLDTPLGTLQAEPDGSAARLTLTLTAQAQQAPARFFYYSGGELRRFH